MKVTEQEVRYVEDLSNLELTADERVRMVKDLNSILEHIDQLNELDTSDVEPMAQTATRGSGQQFANAMREDITRPSLPHDDALRGAPDGDGIYFRVPKVIEK
jgi:aspartyl-tRNA(Asn)/glutamyl-tRNA(Gln) amidotransferase subunit C